MKYLTEKQAAELIGFSQVKLRNDRSRGVGLPYYKFGWSVRYLESDILFYMKNSKVIPASTTGTGKIKRRAK